MGMTGKAGLNNLKKMIMKKSIGSKGRFLIGIAITFAVFTLSNSCTKNTSYNIPAGNNGNKGAGPGTNEVWIQNMSFDPATITVQPGTTIKWTNKDAMGHTVTADDNSFDSGTIGTNGTFSHTFANAGTYAYHCAIHPSMKASVSVSAAAAQPGY